MYHYSLDVLPDDVLDDKKGYDLPLHKLRSFLGGLRQVQLKPRLKMAEPLTYTTSEIQIEVDILVSPDWQSPKELYDYLKDAKQRKGATASQLFR